jgi:lipoate-protein ligase A
MQIDSLTLEQLERDEVAPTLRFFRWRRPTVSYGRLQRRESLQHLIPPQWDAVQRPTGGGIVFHDQDLCFSLAWRAGETPLPLRVKDVYLWVHEGVQIALAPWLALRLATCRDCSTDDSTFHERQCFQTPVAYDLLEGKRKVVGGAITRRKQGLLYQGTLHHPLESAAEEAFIHAFTQRLLD